MDEIFHGFQSRARKYAHQIATEYDLSLNSKINISSFSSLYYILFRVTTDNKVIEARMNKDIVELTNYIRTIIKDDPSLCYTDKRYS